MSDLRPRGRRDVHSGSRRKSADAEAIDAVRLLDWRRFVQLVAEAYRRHGYDTTVTPDRSESGVDLILRKGHRTYLVQCKHWRAYGVDRDAVRALYGQVTAQQADGGVLLATGAVLPDAQTFADRVGLQFVDGAAILRLLYGGKLPGAAKPTPLKLVVQERSMPPEPVPGGSHAAQTAAFTAHLRPGEPKHPRRSALLGVGAAAALVVGIGIAANQMGLLSLPLRSTGGATVDPIAPAAATLELGGRPVAIAIDSAAERGYVADFDAGQVVVVDLATMTRVGTIAAHGRPNAVSVDPGRDVLWLTDFSESRVVAVDIGTGRQVAAVKVAKQPDYLALDPDQDRLYVSSRSTSDLQVINTKSAKKLKSHPKVGAAALAVDSTNRLLYASERETGRIRVFDFEAEAWQDATTCDATITGLAVDGERQRIYTIADGDWVEETDLVARLKDRRELAVPVRALAIDGAHDQGYVLDPESGTLRSFSLG